MEQNQEEPKSKKFLIIAVCFLVLVPAAFLLVNKFLLTGGAATDAPAGSLPGKFERIYQSIKAKKFMDRPDYSFFDDPKLKTLRVYETKKFDITELKVGKKDPFQP